MADHFARPDASASSPSRVVELHQLARQDYTKGQQERASVPNLLPTYAAGVHVPEPSDLDVAIALGRRSLAKYGQPDFGDPNGISHAHGHITESLRILLRALVAEPAQAGEVFRGNPENPSAEDEAVRCSVDRAFPVVAAFLADEREAGK